MASPQPPYGHPGPSSYYQQGLPPPHYVYGSHSPTPYQQYPYPPPPHMNGHLSMHHPPPSPQMNGRGPYSPSPRGAPAYQNYHPGPYNQHQQPPTPSSPYSPAKYSPHPQYSPSYVMQPPVPYPGTWSAAQPLSPLPKQLGMPPSISPGPPPPPQRESHPPPLPSPIKSPLPMQSEPPADSYVGTIQTAQNTSSSSQSTPARSSSFSKGEYVIWSRRPHDPANAPGMIISPLARPPTNVKEGALDLPSPPPSPSPSPPVVAEELPSEDVPDSTDLASDELPPEHVEIPSSSTTESSTAPDTPMPGSPLSSNTSLSVTAAPSPSAKPAPAQPEAAPATPTPEQKPAAPAPAKPAPKSWASLLRPGPAGSASTSRSTLPTSSVVGFSIPAPPSPAPPSPGPAAASPAQKSELLALLTAPAPQPGAAMQLRPRGLINTGNMCFANAVLQILLYCPPFHALFAALGRHLPAAPVVGTRGEGAGGKATPLVDATVEFLREFAVKDGGSGKGKEREEEEGGDSFIPVKVYDAMKEKKRFDNMRGGHQEDAEEFLGFYLDTLEEELLSVANALSPPAKGAAAAQVEEREEEEPPEQDGWLEVGRRNRMVVTRTIKTAESPITRMFGGKFRSTLRAPQQKDSVVIEDWRALQLDIQREQIHTVKDALQCISAPSSVQVTSPTRPGVTLDASQQVLIETVPPILVLHMKRFLYDTNVNGVVKIGKQVSFGPELEIAPEIMAPARKTAQPVRYKLFGVLYHHGLSASGGHYTLDVLHPNRDHHSAKPREGWVRIDDELVSDVRAEDVFGGADRDDRCAYLLFYRRIGGGIGGGART